MTKAEIKRQAVKEYKQQLKEKVIAVLLGTTEMCVLVAGVFYNLI